MDQLVASLHYLSLATLAVLAIGNGGHAKCPCIDAYPTNGTGLWQQERVDAARGSTATLQSYDVHFTQGGKNCTAYAPPYADGVFCYPPEYGLRACAAHDLNLPPMCDGRLGETPIPSWCSKAWCFIDPWQCNVTHAESHTFPLLDLHFSYETCGTNYDADETIFRRQLTQSPLRVTYGLEIKPYLFQANGKWTGVIAAFMEELAEYVGFSMVEVNISQQSLTEYGRDRNSACVNEIALGRADLCIADAHVNAERSRLAESLPVWWQEQLHLVTFERQRESIVELLVRVFKPFDVHLWFFIFGFIGLYALLMWRVEAESVEEEGGGSHFRSHLYSAVMGYMAGGPMHQPQTGGGRLITVGFGFFILTMIASYTANLASFLLQQSTQGKVDSLQDAVSANLRICTKPALVDKLESHAPGVRQLVQNVYSYKESFELMGSECEVQVVPSSAYDMAVAGWYTPTNPKAQCDKMMVARSVINIDCAAFSSRFHHKAISYFLVKLRSQGLLDKISLRREFKIPASKCGFGEAVDQLTVGSMLGTILLSSTLMLLGLLVGICHRRSSRASTQGGENGLSDGLSRGADDSTLDEESMPRSFFRNMSSSSSWSSDANPDLSDSDR